MLWCQKVEFKQVELFLDGTYTKDEGIEFMLKSRCICGYLERGLQNIHFVSKRKRVNIFCSKNKIEAEARNIIDPQIVEVRMHFDASSYFSADYINKQKIYINIIESGLSIAEKVMPIPLEFCVERLKSFESNGYVNEWVHFEKEWKKNRVRCVFRCELKGDEFCQTQEVYVEGRLVAKELISRSKPRESLFYQYLGRATLKNGNEIQYKKGESIISAYDIETGVMTFDQENINKH
jgi:hypothetical protein